MSRRWAAALLVLIPACASAPQRSPPAPLPPPPSSAEVEALVKDGFTKLEGREADAAHAQFEHALLLCERLGDARLESNAHRGLGQALRQAGQLPQAGEEFQRALDIARRAGLHLESGFALSAAGAMAWVSDKAAARRLYEDALHEYELAGARDEQANTLRNLSLGLGKDTAEAEAWIERGLALVGQDGDPRLRASLLQVRGDVRRLRSDFRGAWEALQEARRLMEASHSEAPLVTVLNSLGLLCRLHGYLDQALAFQSEALRRSQALGNAYTTAQSEAGMANALLDMGRLQAARQALERAVTLARENRFEAQAAWYAAGLGHIYLELEQPDQALVTLEQGLAAYERHTGGLAQDASGDQFVRYISAAQLALGRPQEALESSQRSVETGRRLGRGTDLANALHQRARCLQALGRLDEALADAHEAADVLEEVRGRLVPLDLLKIGFEDAQRNVLALHVSLLTARGQPREALAMAERARSRALLDLLASGAATGAIRDSAPASPLAARAASAEDAVATAKRLHSTLLSFFTTDDATFVWAVTPLGDVQSARVPVRARRLTALVEETLAPGGQGARGAASLPTRGGGLVLLGSSHDAWRELHRLLLEPIAAVLPREPGSRLTIVPHGPLHKLSFAALVDAQGRYLVERYALHYAPAVGVLEVTERRDAASRGTSGPLLLADPDNFPSTDPAPPLAALPATRQEAERVAGTLHAAPERLLLGLQASEHNLRALGPSAGLLHFATHAVLNPARPLDSYLALRPTGIEPEDDGRLTVGELHTLELPADLVFLSACRTAGGRLSADGLLGLTRAFLFAGARSVVATLWDIPDQPSERLVEGFYARLPRGADRAAALRAAQLGLLRELRAGHVQVDTAAGRVTLPEDPALWAAFVLIGEP